MARYSEHPTETIYQAAEEFRAKCLLEDGSLLFDNEPVWTKVNLDALRKGFVEGADEGDRTFIEKFKDQVTPLGNTIIRLGAEIVAVHFLFTSKVLGPRKRQVVSEILQWSGDLLPPEHIVARAFQNGVGSGGMGFNTRRHVEISFLIEIGCAFKTKSHEDRKRLLENPWEFMSFLDGATEESEEAQMRHMLLHLLFPDSFERIASGAHKHTVERVFGDLAKDEDTGDRKLKAIRDALGKILGRKDLDFYWSPLREAWFSDSDDIEALNEIEAVQFKKQVVLYGPPGTGKTHRAKRLAKQLIRSAALEQWGGAKYFAQQSELEKCLERNIHRLQLHPAYSYEDFIRGLQITDTGKTEYRPGYLLRLIELISLETQKERLPHVLILDEINRADLSRLFGECFSLLEDRDAPIDLPGQQADGRAMQLRLPSDLFVIGTMNLIDQSVEQIDFALRRRFLWFPCPFREDELLSAAEEQWQKDAPRYQPWDQVQEEFELLGRAASALNAAIRGSSLLGAQYEIGHTYFFDVVEFLRRELIHAKRVRRNLLWKKNQPQRPLVTLWRLSLEPLIREYLGGLDAGERDKEVQRLGAVFTAQPPVAE